MAQGPVDGQAAGPDRREQLLRSALEVIVARGYADTRIADVAEHAGTSPALVIYYFKTRDQLLTEALRYSEDKWYAAGTQRLDTIDTASGRLTELIAMTCLPDTDPAARSEWLLYATPDGRTYVSLLGGMLIYIALLAAAGLFDFARRAA